GNAIKRDEYKNWIIRNFPQSSRARILENPDFLKRLLEEQNQANVFYEETYKKFSTSDYQGVIRNVDYALSEFKGHRNIPKFRLLDAISRGKLGGDEVMSKSLEKLIEDFPRSPESEYAKSLIEALYKESPELELADTEEKAVEIYSTDNSGLFFFGLVAGKVADVNQLKFNLINFNLDNFDRLTLSIEEEDFNNTRIIFVKAFEDYEMGQRYFALFQSLPEDVFKDVDPSSVSPFLISRTNYLVLREDKDFRKYQVFFNKFYQP
ncbi:MAG: hypothetical protein IH594_01475, partial [Bacteroidales bacterium]|nr:hypothetical protein [Bacteroidales bacterium]